MPRWVNFRRRLGLKVGQFWMPINILGFYAGLRAGEIVNLKLCNIIYDGGYVLCIRKSKTKSGTRNVPLYLLIPDQYLAELIKYWKEESAKRNSQDFLFVKNGLKLSSKKTSPMISRHFSKALNVSMRFHHLRHSFANWFLIRWFAAIYGTEYFEAGCDFINDELFSSDYLERMRQLLFGFRVLQTGQKTFSHVFAALARIIGHASPKITIANYIHVMDFLMNLYFRRTQNDIEIRMTGKKIARLLSISHPSLPEFFKGKSTKTLRVQDILAAQRNRLAEIVKTGIPI